MRKSILFTLLLCTAILARATEGVHPATGDGSEENPYLLETVANYVWFANEVNIGNNDACAKMTADINLGSEQIFIGGLYPYSGTFDGDGHTLTFNLKPINAVQYLAPFVTTNDATIKQLGTAGSITITSTDRTVYAAGVVANAKNTTIDRVACSVAITSASPWRNSGIMAYGEGTSVVTNSSFVGAMKCTNSSTVCGAGIAYAHAGTLKVETCFINPSDIYFKSYDNLENFAAGVANPTMNINYYVDDNSLAGKQGKSYENELVQEGYLIKYKWFSSSSWGQDLWIDKYPTPLKTGLEYVFADGFDIRKNDMSQKIDQVRNNEDFSYERNFNGHWQALCVPFSLAYDDWKDDFDIAQINGMRIADTDGDGVVDYQAMDVVKLKSGSTKKNTPYVIRAKEAGKQRITCRGDIIKTSEATLLSFSTTTMNYVITPTINATAAADMKDQYAMDSEGSLVRGSGEYSLPAQRWYMTATEKSTASQYLPTPVIPSGAKFVINVLDDATDINTTPADTRKESIARYNITGQRVAADAKGIIIINGKKYVNK